MSAEDHPTWGSSWISTNPTPCRRAGSVGVHTISAADNEKPRLNNRNYTCKIHTGDFFKKLYKKFHVDKKMSSPEHLDTEVLFSGYDNLQE